MQTDRWAFTANNFGDWRPRWQPAVMQYLVWQHEIGHGTGTNHIQGYVRFTSRKRLETAKDSLGLSSLHLEKAQGNEEQNRNYCTKTDTRVPGTTPVEHGTYVPTKGAKGKRTDLDAVAATIKSGATLTQVALEHSTAFIKYPAGIERLHQLSLSSTASLIRDVHTTVLWGPTGTGKSHRVRTAYPDAYIATHGRDPFGNYQGQRILVLEEFDYTNWEIDILKQLLDKWPMMLDSRYTNKHALWDTVYILTNQNPAGWYQLNSQTSRAALFRRLSAPTGTIVEVLAQNQIVDLTWWTTPMTPTPVLASPGGGVTTAGDALTAPDSLLDYIDLS